MKAASSIRCAKSSQRGMTPADRLLDKYHGEWNGDVSPHLRGIQLLMDMQTRERRTLYPADRALRDRACSTSATATASIGSCAAIPTASRSVFLHGGPGGGISPDHRRQFNPGQIQHPAVRPARLRPVDAATRASRPTRPGTWSTTSRSCATMVGGRQMAGVRRLLGLDPGARLRADPPRAGDRAGAARHLPVPAI